MKTAVIAPLSAALVLLSGCGSKDDKVVGTCGMDGADVEDCDRPDFGSCGNACCKVTATIDASAADVTKALNTSLADGGADGYYTLQRLFEGDLGFTHFPNSSTYLGQVHHMTSGPAHFNDTVDFLIEGTDDGKTTVTAFSMSLIAGALGDAGQGYKNIAMAMKAANFGNGWDGKLASQGGSCEAASSKVEQAAEESPVESRRLASADVVGTCGLGDSTVPDCQNVDRGSCANACCSLSVTVPQPIDKVVSMLNESFADGGADGFYTKAMTYEQSLGFANLTGIAPKSFSPGQIFIGQVNHMTNGTYHFDDTVNFNLVEDGEKTTITAFSISLIGGAYGDAGQNYKNIKMAMDHAFGDAASIAPGNFKQSCPAPASLV